MKLTYPVLAVGLFTVTALAMNEKVDNDKEISDLKRACDIFSSNDSQNRTYEVVKGEYVGMNIHLKPSPASNDHFDHEIQLQSENDKLRIFFVNIPTANIDKYKASPIAKSGKKYAVCASQNNEGNFIGILETLTEIGGK